MTSTISATLADRARVLGTQHRAAGIPAAVRPLAIATGTCWADLLTRPERAALARMLDSAARRFWGAAGPRRLDAIADEAYERGSRLLAASDEMAGLLLDVTGRAQVPPEVAAKGAGTPAAPPVRPLAELFEAVREVNCGECWQVPGVPCTRDPGGDHVARFGRAARRGSSPGPSSSRSWRRSPRSPPPP